MDITFAQKVALSRICEENSVVRLAAFGSRARDEGRTASDLDLLVEFAPGKTLGFFGIASLSQELSAVFGISVYLRTSRELSRFLRDQLVQSAEDIYAA